MPVSKTRRPDEKEGLKDDLQAEREKPRVLFLSRGEWPTGMLEVASWLDHKKVADPLVYNMQPPYLFSIKQGMRKHIREGPIDPEVAKTFLYGSIRLPPSTMVRKEGDNTWKVQDPNSDKKYLIEDEGDRLAYYDTKGLDTGEAKHAFESLSGRMGIQMGKLVEADGALTETAKWVVEQVGSGTLKTLAEFDPDVIGFRAEGIMEASRLINYVDIMRHFSRAEIVLGGPDATVHRDELLTEVEPDFILSGEAEESAEQLMEFIRSRGSPRELSREEQERLLRIPGISTPAGMELHRPMLSRTGLESYGINWRLMRGWGKDDGTDVGNLHYSGSRGCPYDCTMCNRLHGKEFRGKSPERMMKDLHALDVAIDEGVINPLVDNVYHDVEEPGFRGRKATILGIGDENFLLNRQRALDFFKLWGYSDLSSRYRLNIQTNPKSFFREAELDEELLGLIDELKVFVQLGVESFNPLFNERIRKPCTPEESLKVLDRFDEMDQDYAAFIMLSDYETTPEEFVESLRLLAVEHINHPHMDTWISTMTQPVYESQVRRNLVERGLIKSDEITDYIDSRKSHPELMDPVTGCLAQAVEIPLEHLRAQGIPPHDRRIVYLNAFEQVGNVLEERVRDITGRESSVMPRIFSGRKPLDPAQQSELEQLMRLKEQAVNAAREIEAIAV